MKGTVAGSQVPEPEPLEGDNKEPSIISPQWVIKSHHQHLADYVRLFMEEGQEMSMGAPLVTDALQKIHLASHIRCMVDLLHADVIQQLEMALLRTPAAQVIYLLLGGLAPSSAVTVPAQPHPRAYTLTPPVSPTSVLVVGVSTTSLGPAIASTSVGDKSVPPKAQAPKVSKNFQHHQITPTMVESSSSITALSSPTEAETFPVIDVPELAVPAEAYPEHLNRPGGGKDYLCCPSVFRHCNLVSILSHVRNHLEIITGCPFCGKGYQNTASLCKHGRDTHHFQTVVSTPSLSVISEEGI